MHPTPKWLLCKSNHAVRRPLMWLSARGGGVANTLCLAPSEEKETPRKVPEHRPLIEKLHTHAKSIKHANQGAEGSGQRNFCRRERAAKP
jgi:hypothetical protein